ncbi:unnamed protein product [Clonostachys rosea f. rosea IK726]|uniref:Uncharacterized protein n=1 Tax=Clonostachys rosea f. rosea IK726 TaxID=1349383 RepID=A0ACA9TL51_BIOOC|nr:unnamed protein product [Clonostachys rosea f. rosea IK726]
MSAQPNSTSVASPGRRVKFVAVDTTRGGLPVKRKQVQHACDSCRRKKRRCVHAHDSATAADESTPDRTPKAVTQSSNTSHQTLSAGKRNSSSSDATAIADQPASEPPPAAAALGPSPVTVDSQTTGSPAVRSRFFGDLNPEGMFLEAAGSVASREVISKGDVGVWLTSAGVGNGTSQFITARPPLAMDRVLLPFVKKHFLCLFPPERDFQKLKTLFVQKVHPLFPVVPIECLDGALSDPTTVVLRQLVSLAAGTDPETSQNLRLGDSPSVLLSPQEFSEKLSSAVRAILETSLIPDRILHIRALAMLSFYTQPTCAEEADLPALLGGRAIHHIHTLGLHHLVRYQGPNSDDLENLYCAVWAMDRINGAMYGRPYLIHERDTAANIDEIIKRRSPCFRLFLSVVQWLDQVVDLYRPGLSSDAISMQKVAYIDLPVLEAMIVEADALRVPPNLIATIETFYHSVIILSCRLARPGTISAASTLPPPSANARRSLAAERIACAVPRDCPSSLPFIPYAVSLALSVEYRKMRHSRLPMFRARAMNSFKRNCQLLRQFGDFFWSANVLAGLGERVLREMERAATTLTNETAPAQGEPHKDPMSQTSDDQARTRSSDQSTSDSAAINVGSGLDNMVDFSMMDPISGQDIFGLIDPNFNLNAVEDALEANLDIGLPLNLGDWGQYSTWEQQQAPGDSA